jgi:serine phosphatase RsbU (regulator of sigma subunit)
MQYYLTLNKIHKKKNNIDSALYYHEKYLAEKDEYEKENQFRKVIALEVETATEKQERENHILKQQNQLNQLELNERERLQTISLVGIFLLLVVLFYIAYVNREKHRANTLLKAQKEEIAAQAANLEAANSAITLQKNEIEKSHRHITASINYARRIQTAALPDDNEIKDILCDYFVFFKPCDIVSGDFYLLKKINEKIFVVAADCTGHGVPGAFMSMLGMAFLNDILAQNHEKSAAKILNDLRFGIKKALRQDGKIGEQQDGMDMALLIFDTKKREVNFAGANNPLIFFRKGEMHELKADNMPIGIFKKENDFQDHHFAAEINDRFYLFSDGYLSQFGGENNTPLKSKQFKALLNELSVMPFNEQKERVQAFLVAWQGEQKQTDDILVIGLSFDCYFDN